MQTGPNFPTLAKAIVFQVSGHLEAGPAQHSLALCEVAAACSAKQVSCLHSPTLALHLQPPPLRFYLTLPSLLQQLATTAAAKIYLRVLTTCGCTELLTPEAVLAAPMADLRAAGLSERKASYLQDLAQHFSDGRLSDAKIAGKAAGPTAGVRAVGA